MDDYPSPGLRTSPFTVRIEQMMDQFFDLVTKIDPCLAIPFVEFDTKDEAITEVRFIVTLLPKEVPDES
jgi:hypothetical protein